MKILIIGEFSAFAKHLKSGFKQLGHHCVVTTPGDDFKGLKGDSDDIKYSVYKDFKILGKTLVGSHRILNPITNRKIAQAVKKIGRPDLILIINHVFVSASFWQVGVSIKYIRECHSLGTKVISLCCGGAPCEMYRSSLRYYDIMYPQGYPTPTKLDDRKFTKLLGLSDLIVPIGWDYKHNVTEYCKAKGITTPIHNSIPLPITIEDTKITSCIGRRIVIFHGIIREQFKGTKYFREALERITKEFPEKVEVVIDGKMPYEQYIELLKRMDILLDQTNSYGMGVNAELGLMQGKVVLSGNEPENENDMQLGRFPCINAKPDVDYLYEILKDLILNPEKVDKIKLESRNFAIRYLDAKIIARRYLESVDLA